MRDLGHIPSELAEEPFAKLRLHGMIIKDGAKMSKSRGNIVNPDEYVSQWGADVMRTYMLFMGPYEEGGDFRDAGIVGVQRFFNRLWDWVTKPAPRRVSASSHQPTHSRQARRVMHYTIKRVSEDIESLSFNTAIAALMEALNELRGLSLEAKLRREAAQTLTLLLAPFAPHLAEELWERLGGSYSVHQQRWPQWDEASISAETVTLVIQVNGKVRDRIEVPADIDEASARALALESEAVQRHLDGRQSRRLIVVPGKLVNVVV
jgi:leucyl-tRNA synthetase